MVSARCYLRGAADARGGGRRLTAGRGVALLRGDCHRRRSPHAGHVARHLRALIAPGESGGRRPRRAGPALARRPYRLARGRQCTDWGGRRGAPRGRAGYWSGARRLKVAEDAARRRVEFQETSEPRDLRREVADQFLVAFGTRISVEAVQLLNPHHRVLA